MFCDTINTIGEWLFDIGALDIPVLSNILNAILTFWLTLLDCTLVV